MAQLSSCFSNARPGGIPADILLWIVVALATIVLLRRTRFGARVYALGANPLATALSGVNVPATTMTLYAASGLAAGRILTKWKLYRR